MIHYFYRIQGSTALHVFMSSLPSHGEISGPQLDTLKILLKAGADPTLKESLTESTPLHFAVERDKNVLKILLELYSQGAYWTSKVMFVFLIFF